jgi:glycogen operon protein
LREFAYRLTGSSDLYADDTRNPFASINFITAHDGFTLRDLGSYHEKHNQANGEDNRDGTDDNRSWNCGVEGPTDDPEVLALRARQQRNFLATLILSQGIPMLVAGDECGRTQSGNNNTYCQDNEVSWLDWVNPDHDLLIFSRKLIAFRLAHPAFRRRNWFRGRAIHGADIKDIAWFVHTGQQMTDEQWQEFFAKSIGIFINGDTIPNPNARGEPVVDASFFLIFNSCHEALDFTLPAASWGAEWTMLLDTTQGWVDEAPPFAAGAMLTAGPQSFILLQRQAVTASSA